MGEVIDVNFGIDREWDEIRAKLIEGFMTIGELFGDDKDLMRAKAESVVRALREIVQNVPQIQFKTTLPEDLSVTQLELVTASIKEGAVRGMEVTMQHAVHIMMANIYDFCTSKLAGQKGTRLQ